MKVAPLFSVETRSVAWEKPVWLIASKKYGNEKRPMPPRTTVFSVRTYEAPRRGSGLDLRVPDRRPSP